MLSDEQKKQVGELIEAHAHSGKFTFGQKYQITLVLGGIVGAIGITAVIAGVYGVINAANTATNEFVRTEISSFKIPNGIVAAFKLKDGCPNGWTEYAAARGRTIVGVLSDGSEVPDGVSTMNFQDLGGRLHHRLTGAELPVHEHEYLTYHIEQNLTPGDTSILAETTRFTMGSGENVPHANLQPYVALYYCAKDS